MLVVRSGGENPCYSVSVKQPPQNGGRTRNETAEGQESQSDFATGDQIWHHSPRTSLGLRCHKSLAKKGLRPIAKFGPNW